MDGKAFVLNEIELNPIKLIPKSDGLLGTASPEISIGPLANPDLSIGLFLNVAQILAVARKTSIVVPVIRSSPSSPE